ncbi:maleylpyruvate isomerase family mycothiol-dependent enzyme [Streptomyces sodiiphilus]|uniref:Maleylpyruvate isomerase family mycothiol-dependent enzyme n=2 Tax=Streptomyces sodiiphilus TaxID=226217 RepID=A0ABP5A4R8_9ACTN
MGTRPVRLRFRTESRLIMTLLTHDRYCDEIVTQSGLLRELLGERDLYLTVPTRPDWTLEELTRHVGGNLLAVEAAVRTGEALDVPEQSVPGLTGPLIDEDPAALDPWLADAAERCAAALRDADPDDEAQVWGVRQRNLGWARRAAHDLLVHRADAAGTVEAEFPAEADVAADAVEELLDMAADPRGGVASPALEKLYGSGKTLHLHATDTGPEAEWLVEFGPDGKLAWRRGHERATVAVRATVADLLRVVHRRLSPRSERVEVLGEAALLDFWLEHVSLD